MDVVDHTIDSWHCEVQGQFPTGAVSIAVLKISVDDWLKVVFSGIELLNQRHTEIDLFGRLRGSSNNEYTHV